MNQMPILERRRIEALVLKNVYEVLRERSGEEEAQAAIGEAVTRSAIEQGKNFAEELAGRLIFRTLPIFSHSGPRIMRWKLKCCLRGRIISISM